MALEASSEAYDTWVMFVLHNQMSCVYFLCQLIYKGVRNFRIALHDLHTPSWVYRVMLMDFDFVMICSKIVFIFLLK